MTTALVAEQLAESGAQPPGVFGFAVVEEAAAVSDTANRFRKIVGILLDAASSGAQPPQVVHYEIGALTTRGREQALSLSEWWCGELQGMVEVAVKCYEALVTLRYAAGRGHEASVAAVAVVVAVAFEAAFEVETPGDVVRVLSVL